VTRRMRIILILQPEPDNDIIVPFVWPAVCWTDESGELFAAGVAARMSSGTDELLVGEKNDTYRRLARNVHLSRKTWGYI
jgi:hypothetical protein